MVTDPRACPFEAREREFIRREFSETRIVLDHVGSPIGIGAYAGRHDEVFATWAAAIRDLATCPNAFVKLGGLGMRINGYDFHLQPEPPSSEVLAAAWRPYLRLALKPLGRLAVCWRAIFRWTKARMPTPCSGTRARNSRAA